MQHDTSSLRIFGSTGEPWNPEPYKWLSEVVGGGRLPIINISGGTEVGACFITPYPVEEIKVCSLGGASHGMDIDVFDPEGRSIRWEVGELVCKRPWPGMTRGIWGDPERYIETYWSMYEESGGTGTGRSSTSRATGFCWGAPTTRSTWPGSGCRTGRGRVGARIASGGERVSGGGRPARDQGEAIWCFCVLGQTAPDGVAQELGELVARSSGARSSLRIVFVDALPKTRSAKILRRAVRAVAVGEDPGDMSSAENPQALDGIRSALAS